MPRQQLVKFQFQQGYASDISISVDRLGYIHGFLRNGSKNLLSTGSGLNVPFKGLTLVPTPHGSRQNFLTDDGYAGLGDATTPGQGTVFKCIGLLFFMGEGPLCVNGTPILDGMGNPVQASSQFQYLVPNAGVFNSGDDTHRYDVGHAQPSVPLIYAKTPPSVGQKPMSAIVAMNIWRADGFTGQPSRPSESVTVTLTGSSAIVQFPLPDTNGQSVWGIGGTLLGYQIANIYEIPTSQNGEVLESILSYTRTITLATVVSGDQTVTLDAGTPAGNRFTSADIGRRVLMAGKIDSWITDITDAFTAECFEPATANGAGLPLTVTHAVDGYPRAIEVSWSDDDLLATATIAPFYAFEPMPGRFAGYILDTFFIEDIEGTIFHSIPNELSFPVLRNKIFTHDKATVYVDTGMGKQWRIATQSISLLYYISGSTSPIGLSILTNNVGCKYQQNACLGYSGRLMVWAGAPTVVADNGSLDSTMHTLVVSEFDGWIDQTESQPVVAAFDINGNYELWCYGPKVMALHAPTGRWSAPIDITEWAGAGAIIVGQVIVNERLMLVIKVGGQLKHYAWNVGTGSDVTVCSYFKETPGDMAITEVVGSVYAGDRDLEMTYTLVGDFDRDYEVGVDTVPGRTGGGSNFQLTHSFRPNLRGANIVGIKVEIPNADGRAAIDFVNVFGEWNESWSDPRSNA